MKITKKHLDMARLAGACGEAFERNKVGMDISRISFGDLVWVEENCSSLVEEVQKSIDSSWLEFGCYNICFLTRGDGYGYGYCDGDGDGCYGSGFGFDSGFGFGDGSGYGFGDGSGYGDGYSYGCYGYGSGDGYGSGAA